MAAKKKNKLNKFQAGVLLVFLGILLAWIFFPRTKLVEQEQFDMANIHGLLIVDDELADIMQETMDTALIFVNNYDNQNIVDESISNIDRLNNELGVVSQRRQEIVQDILQIEDEVYNTN